MKLCRDTTSENWINIRFKMALFDNGNPEEFLLFVWNFQMTLEESGYIAASINIRYLPTLLRGEVLHQLGVLLC